jgi:hypothetical protein
MNHNIFKVINRAVAEFAKDLLKLQAHNTAPVEQKIKGLEKYCWEVGFNGDMKITGICEGMGAAGALFFCFLCMAKRQNKDPHLLEPGDDRDNGNIVNEKNGQVSTYFQD